MYDDHLSESSRFMLEEYRNIAATHDKLRDHISHLFNYFLIIAAVPFTVAGLLFRETDFNFFSAPVSLHVLYLVIGLVGLFMGMSMVDARFDQYRYAHTVNLIRKYFLDKAPALLPYLLLPTRGDIPPLRNLGFVGFQVSVIAVVGALYAGYGAYGIAVSGCELGKWVGVGIALVVATAYVLTFIWLRARRKKKRAWVEKASKPHTVGDGQAGSDHAAE